MGIASSLIDVVRAHCLLPALAVVALTVGLDGDLRLGLPEAVAFCGMVLVYNLDQQYADPADLANAPHRTCWRKTYRRSRLILMAAAGAGLLAVAVRTPQLALPLVLGALAAALYVLPACGVRIKDLPAVKTLYPPLILAAAILGPNSWLVGSFPSPYLIAWCYLFLLMNVWLFDLRDIEGDRTAGVRTLAVLVGPAWSRGLLFGVAFVAMLMGFTLGTHYHSAAPIAASVVALGYTKERTWLYYELVVDGILLLPLLMLE